MTFFGQKQENFPKCHLQKCRFGDFFLLNRKWPSFLEKTAPLERQQFDRSHNALHEDSLWFVDLKAF